MKDIFLFFKTELSVDEDKISDSYFSKGLLNFISTINFTATKKKNKFF